MKKSIITGILAALCLIMLIVSCAGISMADKNAPVIKLNGENTLTYTEGDSYDELLENMTAEDDRDGDVTESIRVSNLYVIEEDRAVVVYVAKDQANNIGKLKREIHYQAKIEEAAVQAEEEEAPEEEKVNAPRITMIQNQATLKVGAAFNILQYIQSAVDKDGTDLSRSIHIDGTYDMNQAGVYEIRVYAMNGNGEPSNIEIFTLTVEP